MAPRMYARAHPATVEILAVSNLFGHSFGIHRRFYLRNMLEHSVTPGRLRFTATFPKEWCPPNMVTCNFSRGHFLGGLLQSCQTPGTEGFKKKAGYSFVCLKSFHGNFPSSLIGFYVRYRQYIHIINWIRIFVFLSGHKLEAQIQSSRSSSQNALLIDYISLFI